MEGTHYVESDSTNHVMANMELLRNTNSRYMGTMWAFLERYNRTLVTGRRHINPKGESCRVFLSKKNTLGCALVFQYITMNKCAIIATFKYGHKIQQVVFDMCHVIKRNIR